MRLYGRGTARVAVTLLRLVFQEDEDKYDETTRTRGYSELPSFYFEGWIPSEGGTYDDPRVRVRGYAYLGNEDDREWIDEVYAQVIPGSVDPDARVRYVKASE